MKTMGEMDTRLAAIEAQLGALSAHMEHVRENLRSLPDRSEVSNIVEHQITKCREGRQYDTPTKLQRVKALDLGPLIKSLAWLLAAVAAAVSITYGIGVPQ